MIARIHSEDRGLTLTEVLVAVFLLTVVGIIFTQTLSASVNATRDFEGAARSNDSVRIALERIDREFRSAEKICAPLPGNANVGNTLDFHTRAVPAGHPTGTRHVIYSLRDADGDGNATDLQRSADGGATWSTVVGGVENASIVDDAYNTEHGLPLGSVGVAVFETLGGRPDSAPSEGRVIVVRLWVDAKPTDRIAPRLETTEISGRNVWTPNVTTC